MAIDAFNTVYCDMQDIDDHDVYDDSLMKPEQPPLMVYLPSRTLMRKIMRICAACTDYTDLYYLF